MNKKIKKVTLKHRRKKAIAKRKLKELKSKSGQKNNG